VTPDTAGITHVRFNIFPDGGVSRLRLFGRFL
jgi:allantoicase